MVKMVVDVVEKERPPEKGGGTVQDLVMNPRAWYVVRNTRGVTGFVGPGSKHTRSRVHPAVGRGSDRHGRGAHPDRAQHRGGRKRARVSGPLENFIGRVEHLDPERQKVKLTVSMFGRETPVELDFVQVQKL